MNHVQVAVVEVDSEAAAAASVIVVVAVAAATAAAVAAKEEAVTSLSPNNEIWPFPFWEWPFFMELSLPVATDCLRKALAQ